MEPSQPPRSAAFVLVHGAWHNASTYTKVIPELAARGHTAVAVDLPGHGLDAAFPTSFFDRPLNAAAFATEPSPVAGITVQDCADRVLGVIDRLRAAGHSKVVLVGHSLGGVTLTDVAERAPDKLHAIVYLAAYMLSQGQSVMDTIALPEASDSPGPRLLMSDPTVTGALRVDFGSNDPAYLKTIKSAFYGDVSDAQFCAASHALTPDEPALLATTPAVRTVQRWGAVSRHYIVCARDGVVPPALQRVFIDAADAFTPSNKTLVHTMETSHSPFISSPKELAAILAVSAS